MSDEKTALQRALEAFVVPSTGRPTSSGRPTAPITPLFPLLDPYYVSDRVYKNQAIDIDGYHFKNCAFINCTLTTSKGNFSFDGCYFQYGMINFDGNALRVLRLASLVQNWRDVISAHVEADGATTIR